MDGESASRPSERVWQAQAIVADQTGCALHEALTLMKTRAQGEGRTLEDVAAAVLTHQIVFG